MNVAENCCCGNSTAPATSMVKSFKEKYNTDSG